MIYNNLMMHRTSSSLFVGAVAFCAFTGLSLKASPVKVTEDGIGANDTVYIDSSTLGDSLHVYAGIVNITLGTGPTAQKFEGFCIDPWHWSVSGPQNYQLVQLVDAPKPPGPMSAKAALQVEELWAQYMTSTYALSSTAKTADEWAAAMQLEIWQTVAGSISGATYSLDSIDNNFGGEASAVWADLSTMNTFLADATNSTPRADLEGLTSGTNSDHRDNAGQDYVIDSVPDAATTAALLGMGLAGLTALRRLRLARNRAL
jgi:hypothetical protein